VIIKGLFLGALKCVKCLIEFGAQKNEIRQSEQVLFSFSFSRETSN
jgi:hypothetical protein